MSTFVFHNAKLSHNIPSQSLHMITTAVDAQSAERLIRYMLEQIRIELDF